VSIKEEEEEKKKEKKNFMLTKNGLMIVLWTGHGGCGMMKMI
jgi:hypothetical protein